MNVEIIEYNGQELTSKEKEALDGLEKLLGKKIPNLSKVTIEPFGVRIENNHVKEMLIFNQNLKTIPESFGNLQWLEFLDLERNQIQRLPESIGNLKSLKYLDLHENKLNELPESFGELKSLEHLDLYNNYLFSLPETFGNLSSLKVLRLDKNSLSGLPNGFGNLLSLKELRLDKNQFSLFPNILLNLKNLRKLWIYKNQISIIPDNIQNLKYLEILGLSWNKLNSLPDTLGELKSLKVLGLSCNNISKLPDSFYNLPLLQTLYIYNNPLKDFSKLERRMKSLQKIILNVDIDSKSFESYLKGSKIDNERLHKYNLKKLDVELKNPNFGKYITDNLKTLQIDQKTLDLWSELHPVPETPEIMANPRKLLTQLEWPKWSKRKKEIKYGWEVIKSQIKMDIDMRMAKRAKNNKPPENHLFLKFEIKEYTESLGCICGFTKVDRRFIAGGNDRLFLFDTAIVLGMQMRKEIIDQIPNYCDELADFDTYVRLGRAIFDVEDFIKDKGYNCHVRVPFDAGLKYVPHAINAGLGELSGNGVVITKEFGSLVRWGMISIDAEIEIDVPVDLNIAEFCDACRLCILTCPNKAITEERIWWRGVLKRKINTMKCWPLFKKYDGCGICLKICPINQFGYKNCMDAFQEGGQILNRRDALKNKWWDLK